LGRHDVSLGKVCGDYKAEWPKNHAADKGGMLGNRTGCAFECLQYLTEINFSAETSIFITFSD